MLVLSRKQGESIVLPGIGVTITVVRIGRSTRIGIEAPKGMQVLRQELMPNAMNETDEGAAPDGRAASRRSVLERTR